MEPGSNNNLILKFHEKDMIDRESIRQSISNKNYKHNKKGSEDLEEWKFTFPTAGHCKIWFNVLLKLKSYFSKQNNAIEMFFNNFDPAKRNSQLPPQIKSIFQAKKDPKNDSNI